ncbi:MAG: transcription termination factor Rho [Fibrobacterota bacterium]
MSEKESVESVAESAPKNQKKKKDKANQTINVTELKNKHIDELNKIAGEYNINIDYIKKNKLIYSIMTEHAERGGKIEITGVLEVMSEKFGFMRSPENSYLPGEDDIYVSPSQIRRYRLNSGDSITGFLRPPKNKERYFALDTATAINYEDVKNHRNILRFEDCIPRFPDEKFTMERNRKDISGRIIDLFTPIGKGQRGLLVAPPRTGKTVLMKDVANSIKANHPEVHLIILLIDERPEEVTDMKDCVDAEVISSTFDEPAKRHVTVSEMVIERAKRLVEHGRDVVILLDSITRLARAYNTVAPHSGRILSGGVDSQALYKPKRFFGAARNIENGGSLTIIATALVETGSKMDEVIFEEFKGTGNMELVLDRALADKRVFPAADLLKSGTRREDLLLDEAELNRMWLLRKFLSKETRSSQEMMEFIKEKLTNTKDNKAFFDSMSR